jgi:hypothetical protein
MIDAAAYKATQTEAQFQRVVIEAAERLGWSVYHFPNAIINPAGWPDLLMLRNGVWRLRELKTERGRLGPRQIERIAELEANGADVAVWKPEMWDAIEQTLRGEL